MSYTTLKADIASYLDRTDLTALIPKFIADAEHRIAREVRPWGFERRFDATLTAGQAFIALPARFKKARSFFLPAESLHLRRRRYSFLTPIWEEAQGTPRYYAEDLPNLRLYLAPIPVDAFPYTIFYFERPVPLTDGSPTNWLTDNAPDLLRYAALLETAPYLRSDERLQVWQTLYDRAAQAVSAESQDIRQDEES